MHQEQQQKTAPAPPILEIIKDAGLTQTEFAREFGLSTKSVSRWCQGVAIGAGYREYLKLRLEQAYPEAGYANRL